MFGAGSDTTASAISITVMACARYPEEHQKVKDELDAVIGRERRAFSVPLGPWTWGGVFHIYRPRLIEILSSTDTGRPTAATTHTCIRIGDLPMETRQRRWIRAQVDAGHCLGALCIHTFPPPAFDLSNLPSSKTTSSLKAPLCSETSGPSAATRSTSPNQSASTLRGGSTTRVSSKRI